MLYHLYELQHAMLTPVRLQAELARTVFQHPWNPISYTQLGRTLGAGAEIAAPEYQGDRGHRLLAAGQQRDVRHALAGRPRHDRKAGA